MTRNLDVGGRQGRGDVPAFSTKGHRVCCNHDESSSCPNHKPGPALARWVGEVFAAAVVLVLIVLALAKAHGMQGTDG